MTIGPTVYGDDRLGLWIIHPEYLLDRRAGIAAFAGGAITDVFLPERANPVDVATVRGAPRRLFVNLWLDHAGDTPAGLAARAIAAQAKLGLDSAIDLDVELGTDAELAPYCRALVAGIRAKKPHTKLRLVVAPFKGYALPVDLFVSDPNLYVAAQTYMSDMSRLSEAEVELDLLDYKVPRAKASLVYPAATPGFPYKRGSDRVVGLPGFFEDGGLVRRLRRGLIFSDDLAVDVGLY